MGTGGPIEHILEQRIDALVRRNDQLEINLNTLRLEFETFKKGEHEILSNAVRRLQISRTAGGLNL